MKEDKMLNYLPAVENVHVVNEKILKEKLWEVSKQTKFSVKGKSEYSTLR